MFNSSSVVNGQLEWIRSLYSAETSQNFPGGMLRFQAVSSSSLMAQCMLLKLEGCVTGEAAQMVK